MPSVGNKEEIEVLLAFHRSLREEILESIRLQNRIITGEAVATGLALGFHLTEQIEILIAALPPVTVVLTALWIVEQSRMMRAGNYMQFLEDKINTLFDKPVITWENWLRRKVSWFSIHHIHHWAQYIGCALFFLWNNHILSVSILY